MLRKYAAHNSLLPFYLAWQVNPNGSHYNINFSYQLSDTESTDLLLEKLHELIRLKAYLRQTFELENGLLMACIHDDLPAEIHFFTSSTTDFVTLEEILIKEPHDITSKSSVRLNIIRFNDKESCIILFNVHHIIMDGLSLSHFIMELNRLIAGEKVNSESADEYILKIFHEHPLQEADAHPELNEYIKEVNEIAADVNYPINNKDIVLFYTDILPDVTTQNLMTLSKQYQISTHNLLLLAWENFISKVFNQQLSIVNYPVNIRTDKSIFGCFVNVVTLPLYISVDDTFSSLINSWDSKIAILKQAAQSKLDNRLNIGTIPSFAHSNVTYPDDIIIKNIRCVAKSYPQIANSNFSIKYREISNKFYFCCELFSGVFPDYFTSSLLPRFFNFLNKLLLHPSESLSNIDLTFTEEKQQLLHIFNDTDAFYPENKTLIDFFEEIVKKYPNKIAVKAFNGEISYFELNDRAERLASFLIEQEVKSDDIVGILIDNRLEMIIAVMAVLKSGAAYLPITHNTPASHIGCIPFL